MRRCEEVPPHVFYKELTYSFINFNFKLKLFTFICREGFVNILFDVLFVFKLEQGNSGANTV